MTAVKPEDFVTKVELLKQQSREASKQLKKLSGELAQLSVEKAVSALGTEPVVAIFKSGVDPEFIKVATILLKPWVAKFGQDGAEPKAIILTACQSDEPSGPVIVLGHPKLIPKVVDSISEVGSLKGNMAGKTKWQGKSADLPTLYKMLPSISARFKEISINS
ncbi:hypothetical protein L0F63_006799 [Massospora cicadina]|nr:hypothetical protein L0F63_006799 [Massospora cicadina]